MSHHGRRRRPAPGAEVRRFGPLTIESSLVLGLVGVIAAGSFLVNTIEPSSTETQVVVGDKKVRVRTVGAGGVMPGPVMPRVIPEPVAPVAPEVAPPVVEPVIEQPKKPKKVPETPAPAPPEDLIEEPGGGVILPGPGNGPGNGGDTECRALLGIGCAPDDDAEAPTDPDEDPAGEAPGGTRPGGQDPGADDSVDEDAAAAEDAAAEAKRKRKARERAAAAEGQSDESAATERKATTAEIEDEPPAE